MYIVSKKLKVTILIQWFLEILFVISNGIKTITIQLLIEIIEQ